MVANFKPSSTPWHRLSRFVTKRALALLLKIKPEDITRIYRWAHVILVVGDHISRFVSYADLPPIVGVGGPDVYDFLFWRRRWLKSTKKAPLFWPDFYAAEMQEAANSDELFKWGEMITVMYREMPAEKITWLQEIYVSQQQRWQSA